MRFAVADVTGNVKHIRNGLLSGGWARDHPTPPLT